MDPSEHTELNEPLFDLSLDLLVIMDFDSTVVRVSPQWERTLGYSPAELGGVRLNDFVHPDDYLRSVAALQALASGDQLFGFENRLQNRQGDYLWFEWRASPFKGNLVYASARDITRRVRAEEKMRESSFLLSEAQRVARLGSYSLDLQSGEWQSSPMLDQIFGIDETFEHTASRALTLLHPDDLPLAQAQLRRVVDSGIPFRGEYRLFRPVDGRMIWVNVAGEVLHNERSEPVKIIGVFQDITRSKAVEEVIAEANHRRQALFEHARDAIFIVDTETARFLEINSQAEALVGWSRQELVGKPLTAIHPPELEEEISSLFRASILKGGSTSLETKILTSDNRRVPVEIDASMVELTGGKTVIQGFVRDITDRKAADEALRQSEEHFRVIFQTSPDSIAITRLRDGMYVDINESFSLITGYSREEILGRNNPELGLFVDLDDRDRLLKQLRTFGVVRNYEAVLRIKDGSLKTGHISARILDLKGETYVLTFARDITEQKRAEMEIRQSREQLRRLTRHSESVREEERKWMAREVHDELGQIMTALTMDLSWIRKRLPAPPQELGVKMSDMKSLIESAMRSIQRMAFQLRPVPLENLGLEAAIDWLIQDFRTRSGLECSAKITLSEEEPDSEHSTAIFRILQEALNNIIRHARATSVQISLTGLTSPLILRVEDNGCGFQMPDEQNLTSFGLLGMRERARVLGGDLDIRLRIGGGTVLTAVIPLSKG